MKKPTMSKPGSPMPPTTPKPGSPSPSSTPKPKGPLANLGGYAHPAKSGRKK